MLLLHEVRIVELMPMVLYECTYHVNTHFSGCHGKLVLEGEENNERAPIDSFPMLMSCNNFSQGLFIAMHEKDNNRKQHL